MTTRRARRATAVAGRAAGRTRGQAAVELLAVTPAVALAVVALVTALIALTGLVAAEHALDRAVVAAAAGHDVVAATRGALPARLRSSARVHVVDDVVRLRLDLPGAAPVVELEAVLPGDRP